MRQDQITRAPPQDFGPEAALFAERRAAIDLVATMRARSIRAALFGAYLFRQHPTQPEDAATRDRWHGILREQRDALARSASIVMGRDPLGEVPEEVCAWISEHGKARSEDTAAFAKMVRLTEDIVTAVDADDQDALEKALQRHFTFGRGGFFETVTQFMDGLWADLDAQRHAEVENAQATGAAITKTLTRLEHIGKHVRLVSLNASVEAARVGDAGRGLGVIAVEFKTLAEEIQLLATTARADIAEMTGQDGQASRTRPYSAL